MNPNSTTDDRKPEAPREPGEESLAEILVLSSVAGRERYFSRWSKSDFPQLVDRLCDEVNRLVRTDLQAAERLVESTEWLAESSGDPNAQGRHLRAAGNIRWGKRDYRGGLALHERALALLKKSGNQREIVRTLSSGMGFLIQLGEFERGKQWEASARKICDSLDEPLLRARLDFNSGHSLARQDHYLEALKRFQSAYRLFLDVGEPTDIGAALRNIAVTQQQLNDFESALATYALAANFSQKEGLAQLLLEVEYNVAYIYFLRGEFERSLRLFDQARKRCEEVGDTYHMALCDLDQAEIYLELNLIEEAEELGTRALEQFEELDMVYESALALNYLGIAANRSGSWKRSLKLLERCRERFASQGNLFRVGQADIFRAQVLFEQGQFQKAEGIVGDARATFEEIRLPSLIALCEILLGRLALEDGDADRARLWCQSALSRVREIGLPTLEYRVHLLTGQAAESSGLISEAVRCYGEAYRTLEQLRGHLQADELKIGFSEDQQSVFESLICALLSQPGGAVDQRVLELIQKAKSRSLGDLLATRLQELSPAETVDPELAARIKELRAKSNWYHRQIDLEQSRGEKRSKKRTATLRKASRTTEQDLLRCLRQLQMADPELSTLEGAYTVDLESLQARLPPESQLLEYFIARGRLCVCLVDSNRFQVRELADAAKSKADYMLLKTQFGKLASGAEPTPKLREFNLETTSKLLERLYGALIEPVRDELGAKHLIVSPHGFLHHLPFQALLSEGRYLGEDFSISYAPSATVLHLCSTREPSRGSGALVMGVPDRKAPLIEEEARTVAEILPNARLLLRDQASHENLVRYAKDCRLLHIATHGVFRRDNPMFSAIRLSNSRLSVFDLYKLELRADLVVLSGCSTGLSSVQGSDELVGLTRGLLYAGARAVLVSLWDVNDNTTNQFMGHFYRLLSNSMSPTEALCRTQRALSKEHPHPYYWAPFVLVGKVEPQGIGLAD